MILFLCRSVLEFYVEMFSWLLDRDANICVGIEIPRGKFETMSVYVRFLELGLKPHFYCHCCERYGCSRVAVSSVLSFSKTRPRAGSRRRASSSRAAGGRQAALEAANARIRARRTPTAQRRRRRRGDLIHCVGEPARRDRSER